MLAAFVLFASIIAMLTWMAKQGQKMTKNRKIPSNQAAVKISEPSQNEQKTQPEEIINADSQQETGPSENAENASNTDNNEN